MEGRTKRRREIVLGLIGLALVVGVAWALRDPGAFGLGGAGERFVVEYDEALDLTDADRGVDVAGLRVEAAVTPRPIRALATHTVRLRFAGAEGGTGAAPGPSDVPSDAEIDDVDLTFNMEMDMGRHVYRPRREGDAWRADVVLPACSWGGERWYVRVRFRAGGERHVTVFLFDVPRG